MTPRPQTAAAAFWRELAYETRRHAGDERLPLALRTRLRAITQRALGRSARLTPVPERYPRRRVRQAMTAANGGAGDRTAPVVIALRQPLDSFAPALAFLRDAGWRLVERPEPDAASLAAARFVVTDAVEVQQAAAEAGRPSLAVNLDDIFSGYPIHPDGVYAVRHAIDLDTGRTVPVEERLTEGYYRNLRNIGFRQLSAAEILDAAREMHAGVTGVWQERDGQRRFREGAIAAGTLLAARVPTVAVWGPDDGFIGDGRLAACQVEAAA
ncbi:MAG TPA: hypothetical protein VGQ37_17240 [Vicinamibacterales bacterium]|jgi:hypothetical protein|nr:hypothetical protein [Vicinamibacterales bacterium]